MAFIGNTYTTQGFTPAVDYFNGDGSTVAFTLSRPVASVAQIQVVIENVPQNPSSAYTVSGNTITFTSAPPSGTNNIYVEYTSTITQTIAPGQNTVYPSSLSTTNALYWDTSGNVGVGTTSPSTFGKFAVSGVLGISNTSASGYAWRYFRNTTPTAYCYDDGTNVQLTVQTAGALQFGTNDTERMRIDSSGNLLVGVTSGSYSVINKNSAGDHVLQINNSNTSNSASSGLVINTGVAGSTAGWFMRGGDNGAYRVYIYSNGNIVNSNNSYGSLSDIKLKENIVDATSKLDDLCKVRVVNYNFINDPATKQLGVVAQELEEIFPAMIDESPDRDEENNILDTTTKSVKYSVFVPMLIKSIQELKAIIDTQAERIAVLEGK